MPLLSCRTFLLALLLLPGWAYGAAGIDFPFVLGFPIPGRLGMLGKHCGDYVTKGLTSGYFPVTGEITSIKAIRFIRSGGGSCDRELLELGGTTVTINIAIGQTATYTLFNEVVKPSCALIHPWLSGKRARLNMTLYDESRKAVDDLEIRDFSQASGEDRGPEQGKPTQGKYRLDQLPAFVSFTFTGTCTGENR